MKFILLSLMGLTLWAGCISRRDGEEDAFFNELHTIGIDFPGTTYWDIHQLADSLEDQVNTQLSETKPVRIRVDLPKPERMITPPYNIPPIAPQLRNVSLVDVVKTMEEVFEVRASYEPKSREIIFEK